MVRAVGIVDAARDPEKPFGSEIFAGCTNTLRTNNSHLWILPSEDVEHQLGKHGRLLRRQEKCCVAGFMPSSTDGMPIRALERALGNTIPVALLGEILAPIFLAWIAHAQELALLAEIASEQQ